MQSLIKSKVGLGLGLAGLFGLTVAGLLYYKKHIYKIPLSVKKLHLTKEQAKYRSSVISDVKYTCFLDLRTDDYYNGKIIIEFSYQPIEGKSPWIDFGGDQILSFKINNRSAKISNDPFILTLNNLKEGNNQVEIEFAADYHRDGRAIHKYTDPEDNQTYLYTQFETCDAHNCFPCFDQPDLKATMTMSFLAPQEWKLFTNSAPDNSFKCLGKNCYCSKWRKNRKNENLQCMKFVTTKKISTYLYAICAGPYAEFRNDENEIGVKLGLYCTKNKAPYMYTEEFFKWTIGAISWYQEFFDQKYPFDKLDSIFVPEYNFGAMENVGCITYNEMYITKDPMTNRRKCGICNTVYHEIAHMWFGNLVTMKWWDDLWLNESFADFISHQSKSEKIPEFTMNWQQFSSRKNWGLQTDLKPTTHAIYCNVENTEQAETNFDGISYGKGAAVLKQLFFTIGRKTFAEGCSSYFKEFAFKNAEFQDFINHLKAACFNNNIDLDLNSWSEQWIKKAGANELEVIWEQEQGKISKVIVLQRPASQNHPTLRQHWLIIQAYNQEGNILKSEKVQVVDQPETIINVFNGLEGVKMIMLDSNDNAFCKLVLGQENLKAIKENIFVVKDSLNRLLIWKSLAYLVKDAKMSGIEYLQIVDQFITQEKDDECRSQALSICATILNNNMPNLQVEHEYAHRLFAKTMLMFKEVQDKNTMKDLRSNLMLFLRNISDVEQFAFKWLEQGKDPEIPILEFVEETRWSLIEKLASRFPRERIWPLIEQELKRDSSAESLNSKLYCEYAFAEPETKQKLWESILQGCQSMSQHEQAYAFSGWNQKIQPQILTQYIDGFFELVLTMSDKYNTEFIKNVFYYLQPYCYGTEEVCLQKCNEILAKIPEQHITAVRMLKDYKYELENEIKTRALSKKYLQIWSKSKENL